MRPYLRVANVFEDRIDYEDVKQMHFEPAEFERYTLCPGDLLLNEGQSPELLGRPALYDGEPSQFAFTNSLLRFQPHDGVLSRWALLIFRRYMREGRFRREVRITTNIAHLSAGRFKLVEFPIPPLDEQILLCDRADAELAGVDQLQRTAVSVKERGERLDRSLLAEAFAGQLVPQDPGDEPASVLLDRIRLERAPAKASIRHQRPAAAQPRNR